MYAYTLYIVTYIYVGCAQPQKFPKVLSKSPSPLADATSKAQQKYVSLVVRSV